MTGDVRVRRNTANYTHQQSIGSPMVVSIQKVAARNIGSQPIVGREVKRSIGPRRLADAAAADGAEAARFRRVQLSQADDHRLMSGHDLVVDRISIDAVVGQI